MRPGTGSHLSLTTLSFESNSGCLFAHAVHSLRKHYLVGVILFFSCRRSLPASQNFQAAAWYGLKQGNSYADEKIHPQIVPPGVELGQTRRSDVPQRNLNMN